MKNVLAALMLFLPLSAGAQFKDDQLQSLYRDEMSALFEEHVKFLSSASMEGRKAGSQGELEAARYVSEQLAGYGVDVLTGEEGDLFGIKQENGDTLTSRNVFGFIKGYDKDLSNHYIVIGARLDNLGTMTTNVDGVPRTKTFYGANGNGSGLAMLIELAGQLNTNSVLLRRSVIIAAFGSSLEGCAGSWYFLNRSFEDVPNIDAMINLDMLGTCSNGFYAYTCSNTDMNDILKEVSETLQPAKPTVVVKEPVGSDHRSFYEKEIPSVFFTTGMYPEYNSDRDTADVLEYDDMEREMEYIYNFTVRLANGSRPEFRPSDLTKKRHAEGMDVVPYSECDYKPTFLGSNDPLVFLKKWVYVYMKYPKEAVENGIQGKVLVDFIIDEKGKVRNVKVIRGADPLLDAEAIKVVEASPDWKPGRVRGEKVKTELSMYIEFRLEKKKNR